MEPSYDRSAYAFRSAFAFPQPFIITPSVTPSLINYVPSTIGGGFQSRFEDSLTDISSSKSSSIANTNNIEEGQIDRYDDRCEELWRAFRDEAGPWMTHRFSLEEWDSPKKPKTNKMIEKQEASVMDLSEFDGCLTKEMIAGGLSKLDRCPVFYHYSYTKCQLSKKKITDIEALGNYHYLQYLDVSSNKLTTLQPLDNLPFLKYLDASHNLLTKILDFKPPHFLTTVNLSYNKIKTMKDLSDFWSLTDLNLSHNGIRLIDGVKKLRFLTSLNMSYNRIESIENLAHLRLQFLSLQSNQIQAFDDDDKAMLSTLHNIRTINLARNQVSSLKIFENVENLEALEIPNNHISQLLDIYYLRNLKYLNKLNLSGNAVTNLRRYVEVCITNIRNLVHLDGQHINYEFWLQKLSNRASDVHQVAAHQRLKLLILEQLNKPQIWEWILPYDSPPLAIIVLVGLQASRRAHIAKSFCKANENIVLGIPYTTRTKHAGEVEGDLFYFVTEDQFRTMLKEGKFLTYQEHLGFYYGFAHSEFKKAEHGVLLFYTDLTMALSIKSRFFNTKLILTLPSTRKIHLENLSKLYAIRLVNSGTMKIISSPVAVKYCEAEFIKEKTKIIENDIKRIVEDLVIHASMHEILESGSKMPMDSAGIFQIWSAPNASKKQGRMSRRIHPVDPYYRELTALSSIDAIAQDSKIVSFDGSPKGKLETLKESQENSDRSTSDSSVPQSDYGNSPRYNERTAKQNNNEQVIDGGVEDQPSDESTDPRRTTEEQSKTPQATRSWVVGTSDDDLSRVRSVPSKPVEFFTRHSTYYDILSDDERIRSIFIGELNRREELLELHWSTPGLFRELLLTDHEEETMEKLEQLLKDIWKYNATRSNPMFDYNNDESVKALIEFKLKKCFINVEKELSISDKQAAEYFVDNEQHSCGGSVCVNSACPPFEVDDPLSY